MLIRLFQQTTIGCGQVGTYTKTYTLKPLFGVTDNVYLCPEFESLKPRPAWPVSSRSNFTGSVELSSSKPFYYFMLHETPEGESPDLVKAYFMAWDPCEYDEPAVWDSDLNKFVIQYTNYWHDEKTWRVGWHYELEIKNNTDQAVTYTFKHIPIMADNMTRIPNRCSNIRSRSSGSHCSHKRRKHRPSWNYLAGAIK